MNRFENFSKKIMLFFIAILLPALVAGCGNWKGGSNAPAVSSTVPANNEINVPTNRKISAIFTEAMSPATITATSFTVSGPGTTPVAGIVSYTGVTATFTPANLLADSTEYTATITTAAKTPAGIATENNYVWKFTTGITPDITAPTVTSTGAANGATGLPVNRAGTVIFSEAMDPITINTATYTTTSGVAATPVAGTVTYTGVTATFTPAVNLTPNTTYTSTITTGAKDLAGNPMANNYVWSWTTGATADTTAPTVTSTGAANGATGLPINRASTAIFSEQMNPLTISTTTFKVTSGPLNTPVTGTVTYAGVIATFTPAVNLTPITTYTSTITTGAIDLAGNPMASNYVWSWTTGATPDTTRPTVIATGPYGATGLKSPSLTNPVGFTGIDLPLNRASTATFSEQMDQLSINTATVKVTGPGTTPVSGTVTHTGTTLTFTPNNILAASTTYTTTISGGVNGVKDLAGNTMANDYVLTWITGAAPDTTPPTITLSNPVHLGTNIALNQSINATFSEEMKPATMITANFTVKETAVPTINLPGTVAYDALSKIATFSPQNPLKADTNYTVTVTNGATDLAGNALVVPSVNELPKANPWTFTTVSAAVPPPVAALINLGSAGTFGIMATSATTSTGPTQINGDVALSPGTSQAIPPAQVNGVIHVNDAAAAQAKADLLVAYNFAKALPPGTGPNSLGGGADLSGLTLSPGTYTSGTTILINGPAPVTLDGGGNSNATWVFQIGSSFTSVTGSVVLTGGAQAKNIFWVPTAAATIGTNTIFNGTILAGGDVTANTGATINGAILAGAIGAGTVALQSTTVTVPAR